MKFAIILSLVAGCGIADFDVTQPVPAQTIQGNPLPGPLAMLFPLPLSLDISQQIKAMDTGPIDSVTLKSLTLTIESSGGDWSFVDEVDVYVSASSLPKLKIAHVTSPGAVRVMRFVIEPGVNLKPYIDAGSQVESDGSGREPTQDTTYDGQGVFTVHPA